MPSSCVSFPATPSHRIQTLQWSLPTIFCNWCQLRTMSRVSTAGISETHQGGRAMLCRAWTWSGSGAASLMARLRWQGGLQFELSPWLPLLLDFRGHLAKNLLEARPLWGDGSCGAISFSLPSWMPSVHGREGIKLQLALFPQKIIAPQASIS